MVSHKITVLGKEGCHLCERAINILKGLQNPSFVLEVLDITKDSNLFREYFLKIPVVRLDGKDVFEVEQIALQDDCRKNLSNLVESISY